MPTDTTQLLAMLNLALCCCIILVCIGRLTGAGCKACWVTRLRWVLLLTAAQANGWQPLLFQTWPNAASVGFAAVVLLHMVLQWQKR